MDFDPDVLESVVERSLDATQVALGDWSAEELFAGDGQGLGVFRLTGSARVRDALQQWSVILKVLPDEGAAPLTAWSLPMREPLAYDSGLLETLPRALRARAACGTCGSADGTICGSRTSAATMHAGA